jgi:hypothetical protein
MPLSCLLNASNTGHFALLFSSRVITSDIRRILGRKLTNCTHLLGCKQRDLRFQSFCPLENCEQTRGLTSAGGNGICAMLDKGCESRSASSWPNSALRTRKCLSDASAASCSHSSQRDLPFAVHFTWLF